MKLRLVCSQDGKPLKRLKDVLLLPHTSLKRGVNEGVAGCLNRTGERSLPPHPSPLPQGEGEPPADLERARRQYQTSVCLFTSATFLAAFFLLAPMAGSAVTLNISPSVTSNSYSGFITLDIAGLTNGEQVVVQKYLDLDGNGSIDAGEPMVDAFKITDGGAMVIGGITNLNVPFDRNSTPGAITTTLNFVASLVVENMVGQYVYKVVSPSGRFSPVTAPFGVTNGASAQSISGTIYTNGVACPHAVVVAQDQQANGPVGGVVADSNGHFFLGLR